MQPFFTTVPVSTIYYTLSHTVLCTENVELLRSTCNFTYQTRPVGFEGVHLNPPFDLQWILNTSLNCTF